MEFRKIDSTLPVIEYLADVITDALGADKRVLWLVPGGSSIAIAAEVSQRLQGSPLHKLIVTLTDERYGDVGHMDSNWQQLESAGFSLPGATMRPVLTGNDLATTVANFGHNLKVDAAEANFVIGFFGIGPDGHTAGILPGSPAATSDAMTAGYRAGQFTRITLTPAFMQHIDEAVIYAVGEAKWPIFDQLESNIDIAQQPAQALKQIPKVTIFNDHKGEAE